MYQYYCMNPIAPVGLEGFSTEFRATKDLPGAHGIFVRSASVHDIKLPKKLLAIARAGAGVNNIPLDECAKKGIVVFNTPGANANGVKELVIAGMLLASRGIVEGINWVDENKDHTDIAKVAEKAKSRFAGTELTGKKLGIIGLGAIGGLVANAASDLGMDVYGYDPFLSVDAAWKLKRDVKHVRNVDEIYEQCDFITLHVGLTPETKESLNAGAIDKMKKGVVVLNFARDLLVKESDVLGGLRSGKIKKYVTDFPNPTVAGQEGCLVIHHLGASTEESEENCAKMAVKELMEYLNYGNIINSVNYPNCNMGICQTAGRIAIFHQNTANMITKFTSIFGETNINIADLTNKSRGEYAYTIMDVESPLTEEIAAKLSAIPGVFRARIVC